MKKLYLFIFLSSFIFANKIVTMETTMGKIKLEIFSDNPTISKTTHNFERLCEMRYYENTKVFKIVKYNMIIAGDPTGTGRGGKSIYGGKTFDDEIDKDLNFNKEGMLAMANIGKNKNTSQFFITTKPTPWLNGKYTIFGRVIEGMDILYKMDSVPTNKNGKPLKNIYIKKVRVVQKKRPENLKKVKKKKNKCLYI